MSLERLRRKLRDRKEDSKFRKAQPAILKKTFAEVEHLVKHLAELYPGAKEEWFKDVAKIIYPWIRGDLVLERRTEFEMKRLIATIKRGDQSNDESSASPIYTIVKFGEGIFMSEWWVNRIRDRVSKGEGIPKWVDETKRTISVENFQWNDKQQACEYRMDDAVHSIGKGHSRIIGRHARIYEVPTVGQHPAGGETLL